jgi:pectate lyase
MTRVLERRLILLLTTLTAAVTGIAIALFAAPQAGAVETGTWYKLVNRHSGLALDILDMSTRPGAELIQWHDTGTHNQQFRFIDTGDGHYRIQARHSNLVLETFEWSTDHGATIAQWTDLNGTNQQWRIQQNDGYATFINRHSAKALDLWEWSTEPGARISQYDPTGATNQQWQLIEADQGGDPNPPGGPIGWATQNGGTTGGGNASAITVSSASALASAVSGDSAKVVRVSGTINLSGMTNVGSNTTVIGDSGARLIGGGLQFDSVHNVIVQNLTFDGWGDDAVNVQDESTNIWFDHNTFGTGYDGALDIKRGSDFITVSWNRFNGTDKTMLLGHSDGNGGQDRGRLRVSYHHNYFNGTNQRTPRVRFGDPVHVFNNYYRNIGSYCVATTQEAGVLFEGNYLENCNRAVDLGQGDSAPGRVVSRDNHLVGSPNPVTSGSVGSIPYGYSLDTPSQINSIVSGGAGAG